MGSNIILRETPFYFFRRRRVLIYISVSIFFIPYILLEVPSNAVLKRFKRPSVYLGILVVSWGIVMTLTGVVTNFGGLVATRVVLGIAEAGFFPGAVYLITR